MTHQYPDPGCAEQVGLSADMPPATGALVPEPVRRAVRIAWNPSADGSAHLSSRLAVMILVPGTWWHRGEDGGQ